MSDGKIFNRHRERHPKTALLSLMQQSPFLLGTMGWACVALGLSLLAPEVVFLAALGWGLTLGQFRFFRLTFVLELGLFALLFSEASAAIEWTATGFFLSFLGRGLSTLARRLDR